MYRLNEMHSMEKLSDGKVKCKNYSFFQRVES